MPLLTWNLNGSGWDDGGTRGLIAAPRTGAVSYVIISLVFVSEMRSDFMYEVCCTEYGVRTIIA